MRILCLGDSLTYGYGVRRAAAWPQLLSEKLGCPVDNAGVSGDTTGGMLARFAARNPDTAWTHLIVMGGSNDLIMGLSEAHALSNLKTIIYQAVQAGMQVTVGIPIAPGYEAEAFPLLPKEQYPVLERGRDRIKKELESFCAAGGLCRVIDFQEFIEGETGVYLDGLHLSEKGNRLVSEGLYAKTKKR